MPRFPEYDAKLPERQAAMRRRWGKGGKVRNWDGTLMVKSRGHSNPKRRQPWAVADNASELEAKTTQARFLLGKGWTVEAVSRELGVSRDFVEGLRKE